MALQVYELKKDEIDGIIDKCRTQFTAVYDKHLHKVGQGTGMQRPALWLAAATGPTRAATGKAWVLGIARRVSCRMFVAARPPSKRVGYPVPPPLCARSTSPRSHATPPPSLLRAARTGRRSKGWTAIERGSWGSTRSRVAACLAASC